jgi:hypothetical protein
MAASRSTIESWLKNAQEKKGATHVIVRCDNFGDPMGDCCYPVVVMEDEDVRVKATGGDRVMEVYSLTGKHSIEKQMKESRAFHYD